MSELEKLKTLKEKDAKFYKILVLIISHIVICIVFLRRFILKFIVKTHTYVVYQQ